jgi:hypothetical protein
MPHSDAGVWKLISVAIPLKFQFRVTSLSFIHRANFDVYPQIAKFIAIKLPIIGCNTCAPYLSHCSSKYLQYRSTSTYSSGYYFTKCKSIKCSSFHLSFSLKDDFGYAVRQLQVSVYLNGFRHSADRRNKVACARGGGRSHGT